MLELGRIQYSSFGLMKSAKTEIYKGQKLMAKPYKLFRTQNTLDLILLSYVLDIS